MAFTALASGDHVTDKLALVIPEFKVAMNQREAALGISQQTYTGSSIEDAYSILAQIRSNLANLIGTGNNVFLKNDGVSTYADVAAVLTAAGYGGGWDTNYEVSNKGLWIQLQDVFGVLKKYRRKISPNATPANNTTAKSGNDDDSREVAWDNAVSAGPTTETHDYVRFQGSGVDFSACSVAIVNGAQQQYNLAGLIGTVSSSSRALGWEVHRGCGGPSVEVHDNLGNTENLPSIGAGSAQSGTYTWVGAPTLGGTYTITYTLTEQADSPFSNDTGAARLIWLVDTHVDMSLVLDATSGLTYG